MLAALVFYTLKSTRKKTKFEKASYLLSAEYFLSPETFINPLFTLVRASKQLPFVLMFRYWREEFGNRREVLEKLLYGMAQFISITSFLVLVGIIHPLYNYGSAESFGVEGLIYYSAIFGATHAASSYFVASILVLLNGFISGRFKSKLNKLFNTLLILISLVSLFKAYVRTGWLMLAVGLLFFVKLKMTSVRQLNKALFAVTICILGVVYLYNTNEAFQARISGRTIYGTGSTQKIDLEGSGRTTFWYYGVVNTFKSDNLYNLFFGQGATWVIKNNTKNAGIAVYSHNQFVDSLTQNGIVGLLLVLLYTIYLGRYIYRSNGPYKRLCKSLFWSSVVFAFFQNEMYFDYAVIFSLAVALLSIDQSSYSNYRAELL